MTTGTPITGGGIGEDILNFIDKELKKFSESLTEPWQKVLLNAATELIEKNGPAGITVLSNIVQDIFSNKPPDLTGLSLRSASDILAMMERRSADEQAQIKEFLNGTLKTLGEILLNFLFSVLGAAMKREHPTP